MVYDAARAAVFMNRRDTEPYVRWCGRTAEGNLRLLPDETPSGMMSWGAMRAGLPAEVGGSGRRAGWTG